MRGLCANRNAVVCAAETDYVSLLDDDTTVITAVVARAPDVTAGLNCHTIATDNVVEDGLLHKPRNPSRWRTLRGECTLGAERSISTETSFREWHSASTLSMAAMT